jgi:hypothetical protein
MITRPNFRDSDVACPPSGQEGYGAFIGTAMIASFLQMGLSFVPKKYAPALYRTHQDIHWQPPHFTRCGKLHRMQSRTVLHMRILAPKSSGLVPLATFSHRHNRHGDFIMIPPLRSASQGSPRNLHQRPAGPSGTSGAPDPLRRPPTHRPLSRGPAVPTSCAGSRRRLARRAYSANGRIGETNA